MQRIRGVGTFVVSVVVPASLAILAHGAKAPQGPEKVSFADGGGATNSGSYEGAVTGSGRHVAFWTYAQNLFPVETFESQVVVRDRKTGTNLLASVNTDGDAGNSTSYYPSIAENGRYVVFYSDATDLVASDGNGEADVFVTDLRTGDVSRVSEGAEHADGNSYSYVWGASLSKNGRYVVFYSYASNLADDDGNSNADIFLCDRVRGTLALISRTDAGAPSNGPSLAPSISPNGRYVAYYSYATDLAGGGGNASGDVYVYDTKKKTTSRVTHDVDGGMADGSSYDPVVSDNGRMVAFHSGATDLVETDANGYYDIFLADRKTGDIRLVSKKADGTQGDGDCCYPAMSANGKVLAFYGAVSNLDAADATGFGADVYLADLKGGGVRMLSVNAAGDGGDGVSYMYAPSLSTNGKYLVFGSRATNLVDGDGNEEDDEFLIRVK